LTVNSRMTQAKFASGFNGLQSLFGYLRLSAAGFCGTVADGFTGGKCRKHQSLETTNPP
jgi:hypothetical protein